MTSQLHSQTAATCTNLQHVITTTQEQGPVRGPKQVEIWRDKEVASLMELRLTFITLQQLAVVSEA